VPVRLPDTKPGYFGDPFDLMEFARDTLPPTTVITQVSRGERGSLMVRGTTADNGIVKKVLVNGRPAKAVAENYAEWEITLNDMTRDEITLVAYAVDDFANVEPRPHRVLVHGGKDASLSLLNLPTEEKRPDTARREPPSEPKTKRHNSDAEAIQGAWRMISQRRGGRATARPNNMKWIISGESILLVIERGEEAASTEKKAADKKLGDKKESPAEKGGKQSGPQRGLPMTFQLSPGQSPKQIDIDGPRKGNSLGIYKLDGDELTLCMGVSQASPSYDKQAKNSETKRPATISPEEGTVIVLKRIKD
jgi:uncharacterized protein (TIGR03067 family)